MGDASTIIGVLVGGIRVAVGVLVGVAVMILGVAVGGKDVAVAVGGMAVAVGVAGGSVGVGSGVGTFKNTRSSRWFLPGSKGPGEWVAATPLR